MSSNSLEDLKESYTDFLTNERFNYEDRILTAIDDYNVLSQRHGNIGWGCPRLKVNITELRSSKPLLEQRLRRDPLRHIRAIELACQDIALLSRPEYSKIAHDTQIKVGICGTIHATPSTPRSLNSSSLRELVCVEGVATRVSAIKPKIVTSVHYCPATNKHQSKKYVDATDPHLGLHAVDESGRELTDQIVSITSSVYPTKDSENNMLETEFGLSTFKDHQTMVLQEMPEKAPMGQLPRSIELILDDDLVDKVKPGDRVQIVGVYRALAVGGGGGGGQSSTSGIFRTVVLVNNIQILGRDVSQLNFMPEDINTIKTLSKRSDIMDILGRSLSPSIFGHEVIKKALALQLLSGCEKNLENGTHLRGDINVLMVGDPSTAKSQLLRAVMTIAPLAVSTTGKGSSGVGLTAAVTSDPDTRERRLEAGAMVLADRGIVCVDEFDKMSEADRVAIHEAMEQQTVTIAKAGIHASLNARCSVLAAANPVYGQYDRRRRIQENIGLPDSLLSRFDLLFVVLDQLDPDADRRIASHVIRGHRYKNVNGHDSDYDDDSDSDDDMMMGSSSSSAPKPHSIWQRSRYQSLPKAGATGSGGSSTSTNAEDVLQHDFLRKYLHFAKTRIKPVLTEEARECIASRYAEMRGRQDERTLPVTARSLETVIRLATAHAKARLSPIVEADPDVAGAMDILSFALYHENNDTVAGEGQNEEREDGTEQSQSSRDLEQQRGRKRARLSDGNGNTESPKDATIDLAALLPRIWTELQEANGEMEIKNICSDVADRALVKSAVQELEEQEKIMVDEETVYLV